MGIQLSGRQIEVFGDVFTNLAAGFFGSLIIFPGIFGIGGIEDLTGLLLINLPSGILALLIALKLRDYV